MDRIAYAAGALIGAVALHLLGHPMLVPAGLALIAAMAEASERQGVKAIPANSLSRRPTPSVPDCVT